MPTTRSARCDRRCGALGRDAGSPYRRRSLGVFAVIAAGAVVVQDHSTSHVNIESHTPSSVSTPTKSPTSTVPNVSTTTTTTPRSTVTTAPDTRTTTTNGNGIVGPLPTTSTPPPSTPTSHDDHGGTTTPASTAPVASTKTYTSTGGRATIRFANGRLTLVSYSASAGYTTEVHTNTPTTSSCASRMAGASRGSGCACRTVSSGRRSPRTDRSAKPVRPRDVSSV